MVSFERFHFLFAHSMRTAVSTYQTFSTDEKPLSILDVRDAKNRRKLAMVTAYDTPSARIVDRAGVDMVLVGDSLGMVMLGRKDTLSVTLDEMIHHCRAVVQGIHHALVVADMPFMTYEPGPDTALSNAARLVRESGVRAVKLEGAFLPQIRALVGAGIPVMGHIGLTPQRSAQVKRLFESEVTEVRDGIVEIKCIAREAGSRTKIAVWSNDPDVDPVGACVGMNGARVNAIVNELRGEKIDIINWNENPALLIENALSPAKVIAVLADPEDKTAKVVVPDYQLSLAIGKEGQNARLAARLTGFKIDIKSETQAREIEGWLDVDEEYEEYEDFEEYKESQAYEEAQAAEAAETETEEESQDE